MRSFELHLGSFDKHAINVDFPLSSSLHQVLEQTIFGGAGSSLCRLSWRDPCSHCRDWQHAERPESSNPSQLSPSYLKGAQMRIRALTFCGTNRGTTTITHCFLIINGGEGGIRTLDELLTHTHFPGVLLKPLGHLSGGNWRRPDQPHPGTRVRCCRCSLPGLTGFTTCRCEGTGGVTIVAGRIVARARGMWK